MNMFIITGKVTEVNLSSIVLETEVSINGSETKKIENIGVDIVKHTTMDNVKEHINVGDLVCVKGYIDYNNIVGKELKATQLSFIKYL